MDDSRSAAEADEMKIAITIEAEEPAVSAARFRMLVNGAVVAIDLPGEEAHRVIGKMLERIALARTPKLPRVDLFPARFRSERG
jgi:hypothetical protein